MKSNHKNALPAEPVHLDGRFSGVPMELESSPLRYVPVNMTPALAERLLAKLHPNQRGLKPQKVARMVRQMKAGRWWLNPQPVIVDEDGYVSDGQNRLTAVVRSGCVVPMVICYGAARKSIVVIDTGTPRNAHDAGRVADAAAPSTAYYPVARAMAAGLKGDPNLDVQETLDWISSYRHGLDFAFAKRGDVRTAPGLLTSNVRAVISRAWYTADRARLASFHEQLVTGLIDSKRTDAAVVLLRNWLLENQASSSATRRSTYALAEFALTEYLASRRPAQLLAVSEEQFPLPDLRQFESLSPSPAAPSRN